MVLEFYYDLRSQPCRSVYLFLKANDVPFETRPIDILQGDHCKPDFLKLNPFHKIPVINDNGMVVSESVAIMLYIARTRNLPEQWYPKSDPKLLVRADEFLHWQHASVRRNCIDVFIPSFRSRVDFGPMPKQPLDEAKVGAAKNEVKRAVTHIADYFLKDKKFILGDKVSIADLQGLCELEQLQGVQEENLFESNDKVKAWANRVRESMQPNYDVAMEKIRGMRKVFMDAKP